MAGGGGMQEWKVTKVIDRDFKDPWEFEDSLMGAHHRDPFPELSFSSPPVVADCRMNMETQVLQKSILCKIQKLLFIKSEKFRWKKQYKKKCHYG